MGVIILLVLNTEVETFCEARAAMSQGLRVDEDIALGDYLESIDHILLFDLSSFKIQIELHSITFDRPMDSWNSSVAKPGCLKL